LLASTSKPTCSGRSVSLRKRAVQQAFDRRSPEVVLLQILDVAPVPVGNGEDDADLVDRFENVNSSSAWTCRVQAKIVLPPLEASHYWRAARREAQPEPGSEFAGLPFARTRPALQTHKSAGGNKECS